MTTRRNFLKQSLLAAGAASVPAGNLLAQEKMEEKRMVPKCTRVKGARVHNLKNVIP